MNMEFKVRPKLLLVDDDPSHIDIIANILSTDYDISVTTCGEDALKLSSEISFDAIILDVVMPGMDGYAVCETLLARENFHTPIVFLTSNDSSEEIERGLELGATYYLTKPIKAKRLKAVIKTATDHFQLVSQAEDKYLSSFSLIDKATFTFRTLTEARSLASVVSELCPISKNVFLGLCELMVNAIEHGNLGISYDEKSALNEEGIWEDEVSRRLSDPVIGARKASLDVEMHPDMIKLHIKDQGDGFEWQKYMTFDPERALHSHGRGIAMANGMSFDELVYQGNGNSVIAIVKLDQF